MNKMSTLWNRKCSNCHLDGLFFTLILSMTGLLRVASNHDTETTDVCSQRSVIEMNSDFGHISSDEVKLKNNVLDCQMWRIQASPNSTITISFSKFSMGVYLIRDSCDSVTRVILGPDPERTLCTSKGSFVYHSNKDHVWLKFYRHPDQLFPPIFELDFISSKVENCEYICYNGQCALRSWICNGVSECIDNSDESNCHLDHTSDTAHVETSVAPAATCGYGEILCYVTTWKRYMCLHNMHKCDGIKDCRAGEDENHEMCGDMSCNLVLDEPSGWFASPNFPSLYPSNVHCSWVIHSHETSASFRIQLRVKAFGMESDPATDYLIVYDGPDDTYKQIGTYNGENAPPQIIESSSNWLKVVFVSDAHRQYFGFNFTYQIKGLCLENQMKCENEQNCYSHFERCDGVWNCALHGSDEAGCNCEHGEFTCGHGTTQCYHLQERCNGISRCSNSADESNCTSLHCGSHNGTFLCANKRCIYESWTCDHRNDCGDNSDERNCSVYTRRVIIATISGVMVCALMLVILLGCSCKLYALRTAERHGGPRHETPMSRLYAEFLRRRAPPPYHEAMLTSRNFDEVQQEYMERLRNASRRIRRSRRRTSRNNQNQNIIPDGQGGITPGSAPLCGGANVSAVDSNIQNAQAGQLASLLDDAENNNMGAPIVNNAGSTLEQCRTSIVDHADSIDREPDTDDQALSSSDTESADSEIGPEVRLDLDVDNILESDSLSALWARGEVRDNESSDDACILEDTVSLLNGQGQGDTASVETASASIDLIEMPEIQTSTSTLPKDSDLENESDNNSVDEYENSRNSTPKPESFRGNALICEGQSSCDMRRCRSQSSLDSAGSDMFCDNDDNVPMVSVNYRENVANVETV